VSENDKFVHPTERLRALAEDAMRSTDWRQSGEPTPDDLSEWLSMSAQRLAQVVADKADRSLLVALAEGYLEHLMERDHQFDIETKP
jgi:hypothetical protein